MLMTNLEYIQLVQHPESIDTLKTRELEELIQEFPYFQSARSILLKGLSKTNSYKYNTTLKQTAAHTIDREVLFNFITSSTFISKTSTIEVKESLKNETLKIPHKKITEADTPKSTIPETKLMQEVEIDKETENVTSILEIGKPIQFIRSEPHSFNEWMQLINQEPIVRKEKKIDNSAIIDTFIKTNPKIKPIDKNILNFDISIESSTENSSLMTETLAKVYLEQKKYENAIKAYHILSLKYPEKSGFFADRIKAIKILQKNKS